MKVCPVCNSTYPDEMDFCPKDGARLTQSRGNFPKTRVGEVIDDKYRLVGLLGTGGMGEVYEAQHVYLGRKVAVKLLRPELTANPEAVQRFHREAQAASNIGHDCIVEILDFGKLDDGTNYLVMEYLEGTPLSDITVQGPVDPLRGLDIMIQMCDGLAAAHRSGIIHRDMKPENVFLVHDSHGRERVKILDFGIAKVTDNESDQHLTKTGAIFGTPHYMSPEQAKGEPLDQRSDIYSVGVIMYELFTGTVPFKGESFMGVLTQHITSAPPPPSQIRSDIPPVIEEIILRAIAKEPENRFQSMEEFIEALENARVALGGNASGYLGGTAKTVSPGSTRSDSGKRHKKKKHSPGMAVIAGSIVGAFLLLGLAGGGIYMLFFSENGSSVESPIKDDGNTSGSGDVQTVTNTETPKKTPEPPDTKPDAMSAEATKTANATESADSNRKLATQNSKNEKTVVIRVSTNLDGKVTPPPKITVNGEYEGESPRVIRIRPNQKVEIVVEREGYRTIRRKFAARTSRNLRIHMKQLPRKGGSSYHKKFPNSSHAMTAPPSLPSQQPPKLPPATPPAMKPKPPAMKPKPPVMKPKPPVMKPKPPVMKPKPMKPNPNSLWD